MGCVEFGLLVVYYVVFGDYDVGDWWECDVEYDEEFGELIEDVDGC